MELIVGRDYTRESIKQCKFPHWDKFRAFIFEDALIITNNQKVETNLLVGIVYNPDDNLFANNIFCVYGEPDGDYDKIFGNNPATKKIIPVFHKSEPFEVVFDGCFEVVYIGRPRKNSQCNPESRLGVLVGEIELKKSNKKC